jgi:DNA-binding NarL/FixJ family response regulator
MSIRDGYERPMNSTPTEPFVAVAAPPITLSIVEDDRDTRDTLATLLGRDPRIHCLATYASAEAALADLPRHPPEVALVDINLPGMNGIDCVAQLKSKLPTLHVLMLTTYEESDLIFNSLRAGARGYLLKKMVPTELIPAIEQVRAGGAPMSMQVARKVVDYFRHATDRASLVTGPIESLTPREHEVLTLLAKGCLYKEMSDRLGISMNTIRTHLKRIYEKLHVQSRTEAAARYFGRS